MGARPFLYVALRDEIELQLADTTNAKWSTALLDSIIRDRLAYVSGLVPYRRRVKFEVEGRYGSATSTSSNNLVDATKSQFVSTDADKIILNTTDYTWATIKTYTSATTVALTNDIMTSGEQYRICDKYCRNQRQIYIGDVTDFLSISQDDGIYYKGAYRNHRLLEQNKVLEILFDFWPDDNSLANADVYADVIFDCYHRVSQMTDLAGEIDLGAGYAAGTTTIHVDGLGATETIEEGTLFTIENLSETYCVTADTTLASNEGDINIYPGLEAAVTDNDDITFIGSTLNNTLEPLFIRACVADAMLKYAPTKINTINMNPDVFRNYLTVWQTEIQQVESKLRAMAKMQIIPKHTRL